MQIGMLCYGSNAKRSDRKTFLKNMYHRVDTSGFGKDQILVKTQFTADA